MSSDLGKVFTFLDGRRFPLSRDQLIMLLVAVNHIFLGADIYIAHLMDGTIKFGEWIPIIYGPIAGGGLFFFGLIALKKRELASSGATLLLVLSSLVGLLGAWYHLNRASLPDAALSDKLSVSMLIWGPPFVAPLTFLLVAIWGFSAAWTESKPDSGSLVLPFGKKLRLPYPKTNAYYFLVSLGILATLVTSTLDHARTDFLNHWLWVPTGLGIVGTVVAAVVASGRRSKLDLTFYFCVMLALIAVGIFGALLHVEADLTASGAFVQERFIRGAPVFAPLLYANMAAFGLLAMFPAANPKTDASDTKDDDVGVAQEIDDDETEQTKAEAVVTESDEADAQKVELEQGVELAEEPEEAQLSQAESSDKKINKKRTQCV